MKKDTIGIIVSGGPAPGINNVIHACTLEASKKGFLLHGIIDGFKGICNGNVPLILEPRQTALISNQGGSILGTSRFNPFLSKETEESFLNNLEKAHIQKLIVIGGEGSAYLSYNIAKKHPHIQVVHIPKTIDNDLYLPNNHPSFGFETARHVGSEIMTTLVMDARTCHRWFIATCMGRKAGFLSLGLGIASGATATLIPEEFPKGEVSLNELRQRVVAVIDERISKGKDYGVVILAEGIIDLLNSKDCAQLANCPRDAMGRIHYSDIEIGGLLVDSLRQYYASKNKITINNKNIGYELRCHYPIPFDIEYTKFLGYCAVQYLLAGSTGVIVARDFDELKAIPLSDMIDSSGNIKSRRVDLNSDLYKVARGFMVT